MHKIYGPLVLLLQRSNGKQFILMVILKLHFLGRKYNFSTANWTPCGRFNVLFTATTAHFCASYQTKKKKKVCHKINFEWIQVLIFGLHNIFDRFEKYFLRKDVTKFGLCIYLKCGPEDKQQTWEEHTITMITIWKILQIWLRNRGWDFVVQNMHASCELLHFHKNRHY